MTKETGKEMIEAAAKALGMPYRRHDEMRGGAVIQEEGGEEWFIWNPVTDQTDNDRMGCDLEISTLWNPIHEAYCYAGAIGFAVPHDGTIEGRRAAVRLARTQVAAEMGRAK